MSKSYVTMFTCPICDKPNGTLGLDRRVRDTFEMYTPSIDPCDSCRKKYLKNGVMLVNETGEGFVVVKTSAFKRAFNCEVPKDHVALVEKEVFNKLTKEQVT